MPSFNEHLGRDRHSRQGPQLGHGSPVHGNRERFAPRYPTQYPSSLVPQISNCHVGHNLMYHA